MSDPLKKLEDKFGKWNNLVDQISAGKKELDRLRGEMWAAEMREDYTRVKQLADDISELAGKMESLKKEKEGLDSIIFGESGSKKDSGTGCSKKDSGTGGSKKDSD